MVLLNLGANLSCGWLSKSLTLKPAELFMYLSVRSPQDQSLKKVKHETY